MDLMNKKIIKISSMPDDLVEGLFGQVFLFVFELLPYLDEQGYEPLWEIRSKLYGIPENDFIVIPGLLDVNGGGKSPIPQVDERSLSELRSKWAVTLGNDWYYLNKLWNKFFRIPERITARADSFQNLDEALGLHYRGTDKSKALEETNYVSETDFIALIDDFIQTHPEIRRIFIASDEPSFVGAIIAKYPDHDIVKSGSVVHHKHVGNHDNIAKGEHALLDCLLLSRCKYLLKCQSALSGFAKVLNPNIEAYRVSANKLAYWNPDTPYFPDGHLPKFTSENRQCRKILQKLLTDDWTENRIVARRFSKPVPYENKGRRRRIRSRIDRFIFRLFALNLKF